ncbi:hypothetical protein KW438_20125 [Vibrio fluvialis]|nr:hypothetical protein [Vibrio fluvialis]
MKQTTLAMALIGTLLLTGCNNSEDTSNTTTATSNYSFIDEAVKGLYYESATQSGCTDEDGTFSIIASESVDFYIGRCDSDNKATLTDNDVKIGTVTLASTITTPYDLLINDNATSANPVTVATILKSLTSDAGSDKLDLSGLYLNENGVDVRATLQNLIDSPSTDATTVLNTALFTQLTTANSNKAQPFKRSDFMDEGSVKSELKATLSSGSNVFISSDVAGKTATTEDGTVYVFGSDDGPSSSFSSEGVLTLSDDSKAIWGILNQDFGSNGSVGDLYLSSSNSTIRLLDKRNTSWLVTVNDGEPQKWSIK